MNIKYKDGKEIYNSTVKYYGDGTKEIITRNYDKDGNPTGWTHFYYDKNGECTKTETTN